MNLPDLNFEHSWDIEKDLPWDAVNSSLSPTEPHPPELEPRLVEAITARALPTPKTGEGSTGADVRYKPAVIAFLYIYMTIASAKHR